VAHFRVGATARTVLFLFCRFGLFDGYRCDFDRGTPLLAFAFFSLYIVLTAWVIMSLFIGVISMGMFEALEEIKAEAQAERYRAVLAGKAEKVKSVKRGSVTILAAAAVTVADNLKRASGNSSMRENLSMARRWSLGAGGNTSQNTFERSGGGGDGGGVGGGMELPARRLSNVSRQSSADVVMQRRASRRTSGAHTVKNPLENRPNLRMKLDLVLGPDLGSELADTAFLRAVQAVACRAKAVEAHPAFNAVITLTIVVVGLVIGVDTDDLMACERFTHHQAAGDGVSRPAFCTPSAFSVVLGYLSQAIFTAEMCIKIAAQGAFPELYFADPWNKLDAFVVTVGFVEMSPAAFVFEAFPVVVLRLLRLLRVFRLAKALPRLRSIVEALISGLGAVGWIVVLILVFNYIIGCTYVGRAFRLACAANTEVFCARRGLIRRCVPSQVHALHEGERPIPLRNGQPRHVHRPPPRDPGLMGPGVQPHATKHRLVFLFFFWAK